MENESLLDKLAVTEIKTQSDYLADKIRNMIISGDLKGGFSFPNENEFCKRLNVSRGTLREAYKILDTQGFIQRTKHGTYIKDRSDIAEDGNFGASLELADKQEMEEFVLALEPEAVYLAAQKAGEKEIRKLEQLMLICEETAAVYKKLLETNYQFHAYICELADNNLITSALTAYYDIFNQQVIGGIYINSHDDDIDKFVDKSLKTHRELFDAIKNKDAERAKMLARRHLLDDVEKGMKIGQNV